MSEIAKSLVKHRKGGRGSTEPTSVKTIKRRVRSSANHLTQLTALAGTLDNEDYGRIRDELLMITEGFRQAYEKPVRS